MARRKETQYRIRREPKVAVRAELTTGVTGGGHAIEHFDGFRIARDEIGDAPVDRRRGQANARTHTHASCRSNHEFGSYWAADAGRLADGLALVNAGGSRRRPTPIDRRPTVSEEVK